MSKASTTINEKIFKAYDIRGVYPEEINEEAVYLVSKAYAKWLKPKKVVLGRDVRNSGESLFESAKRGLLEMGVSVVDIGVITSDMLSFAVGHYEFGGGISITASHNPREYNGMKILREESNPISIDTGLRDICDIAQKGDFSPSDMPGKVEKLDILDDYLKKVLSFVDTSEIKPMKIVVNPNFGAGGKVVEKIAEKLKLDLVKLNFEENGFFPKGSPNPLLIENQKETSEAVKSSRADLGVSWDADADRCFFFDETGEFIEGYYTVSVLSEIMLKRKPKSKVVYNEGVVWAIDDTIKKEGGIPMINKTGHSFIKARMKKEDAVFGGEISGHYYFKDFWFCDNGMIPFVLMLEELSKSGRKLSELVGPIVKKYPVSGEINFKVEDTESKIKELEEKYSDGNIVRVDGLSVEYPDWRFNVRASNTEPLLRLNLEAKTKELVDEQVRELTKIIEN